MALVLADRVQEYSTTTGTGTLTLSGAYAGFQTFAAGIGNGNTCYYTITSDTNQWEVGIGTVGVGTLARTTLISSSTGSLVSFVGTLTVFVTYPAEKAVYSDSTTIVAPAGALLPITSGGTGASTAAAARTALGLGTIATQDANAVAVTGGTINGATVGATTVAAGSFSTLNSSGNTRLGGLSGNQSLQVNNVASAVNYAQIVGAATTGYPLISAQGADTNIALNILAKGTGDVFVGGSSTVPSLTVSLVASQVNSFQIYGQATGQSPTLACIGSDTNIGLTFQSKGTGAISFNGNGQRAFNISTASGSDFTNYYNTAGDLNYTAAGGSTNINFAFASKGAGAFNFATSGGRQAAITHTASAVNYLQLTGAATGAAPTLSAAGSDTHINLDVTAKGVNGAINLKPNGALTVIAGQSGSGVGNHVVLYPTSNQFNYVLRGTDTNVGFVLTTKGTGNFFFNTGGGTQAFISDAVSAVNYLSFVGAATGVSPSIGVAGSDTNINLKLTPKGTGVLQFGTYTAGVVAQAGYITITDAGGTSRRLLVG